MGDESIDGPSTTNQELDTGGTSAQFWITLKDLLPGKYLNGVMYITPTWMGLPQLTAIAVLLVSLGGWGDRAQLAARGRHSRHFRSPIEDRPERQFLGRLPI